MTHQFLVRLPPHISPVTARQKLEAEEKRQEIFARDGYLCQECAKSIYVYNTPQLAHRIAQTKGNKAKYGLEVIHHPLNLVSVCSLRCNDAQNIGFNPEACRALVEEIKKEIENERDQG